MNPAIYLEFILDNIHIFVWILLFLAPIHIFLLRAIAINFFDPVAMVIFADLFCSTLVVFMWKMDDIAFDTLAYYALTQLAFYGAMLTYKLLRKPKSREQIQVNLPVVQNILLVSAVVNIVAVSVKWSITGIPLFKVSRLGSFMDSGGLGIIERLEIGSYLILAFSALWMWINFKKKMPITISLVLVWLLTYDMLSGSKAALLGLIQIYFFLRYIFSGQDKNNFFCGRLGVNAFILATLFSILVLIIERGGDLEAALVGFVVRVVSFGDIYIYAYFNNAVSYLQGENPFIGLFGGILSTFRIIPVDWMYKNMGLQFSDIVFPNMDYIAGPNPRHAIFGFHYFGWGGVLFSAGLGFVVSFFQFKLYQVGHQTYLRFLWRFLVYFSIVGIGGDFDQSLSTLASVFISFVFIVLISSCFNLNLINSKK